MKANFRQIECIINHNINLLISTKRQFNWRVSDVFYFMKKSALVFELCYFKDTWLYFITQNSQLPFLNICGVIIIAPPPLLPLPKSYWAPDDG